MGLPRAPILRGTRQMNDTAELEIRNVANAALEDVTALSSQPGNTNQEERL